MTAQIYYKIQNTSARLGNKQLICQSRILEEKIVSKVILELTVKNVDKFYYFILPNIM